MAIDKRTTRLGMLALVSTLLIGALGTRLWFLQGVEAASFQAKVSAAKLREVLVPPERGRIFDAKGRIMADNQRILTVAIDWSVIKKKKDRDALFDRLSGPLKVPVDRSATPLRHRASANRPSRSAREASATARCLPLPLKEGVDEDTVTYLKERSEDFPGIQIVEQWKRVYPYAPLASHVVGYLGPITKETKKQYEDKSYNTNELVGAFGVELSMEDTLHGAWGRQVFEVDAAGGIVRELVDQRVDPIAGRDIQLTHRSRRSSSTPSRHWRPSSCNVAACRPTSSAKTSRRTTRSTRRCQAAMCACIASSEGVRPSGVDPVQGAGRLRGGREQLQWPDRGDGQLPDGSTTAGWATSAATSSTSCSARRSTRTPARPIPTSRCWSTAPCRATTTSVRPSSRSSRGRRCTRHHRTATRSTSTRASTSSSRFPSDCLRQRCALRVQERHQRAHATIVVVRAGHGGRRTRRQQRRLLLPDRREVLDDGRAQRLDRSGAEGQVDAEDGSGAVRVRSEERRAVAVRVAGSHPRRRHQGAARQGRCARRQRGATSAGRRQRPGGDRPGPDGRHAAAAGQRLLDDRQRWLPATSRPS